MSDAELKKQRDAVIEEIKQAFPTTNFTGKLINDPSYGYQSDRLTEMLSSKNWLEVISDPNIFYNLGDVDFLNAISGDAYHYYLPALLTASLTNTEKVFYAVSTYQQIREIATSLTVKQLKALMHYLEYQERCLNLTMYSGSEAEAIWKTYLRLFNLLCEQGSRAMRD